MIATAFSIDLHDFGEDHKFHYFRINVIAEITVVLAASDKSIHSLFRRTANMAITIFVIVIVRAEQGSEKIWINGVEKIWTNIIGEYFYTKLAKMFLVSAIIANFFAFSKFKNIFIRN